MVLVHLLLYLVGPYLLRADPSLAVKRPHATLRQFSIDLAPDAMYLAIKQHGEWVLS